MLDTLVTILRAALIAEAMDDMRRAAINLAAADDLFASFEVGRTSNKMRGAWASLRSQTRAPSFIPVAAAARRALDGF